VADFPATTCVSLGVSLEGDDHKDRVISGERVTDPVSSLCTWPSAQVGFSMSSFFFFFLLPDQLLPPQLVPVVATPAT
jgi:hypothetical protein